MIAGEDVLKLRCAMRSPVRAFALSVLALSLPLAAAAGRLLHRAAGIGLEALDAGALAGEVSAADFVQQGGEVAAAGLAAAVAAYAADRSLTGLLERLEARGLTTEPVSEVAFSPSRGFTVHHGQARLVFGHGELPRQLDRLERLVREEALDLAGPTWVDLAPSTVAIVRPLPAAAEGS